MLLNKVAGISMGINGDILMGIIGGNVLGY